MYVPKIYILHTQSASHEQQQQQYLCPLILSIIFAAEYGDRNAGRNTGTASGFRPHASELQKRQLNLKSQLLLAYCNSRSTT